MVTIPQRVISSLIPIRETMEQNGWEIKGVDREWQDQVATFRYGLISPIVSRGDLPRGEQARIIREVSRETYRIPGTTRRKVSPRTLERYLAAYRRGGLDGLRPRIRDRTRRIDLEALARASKLKRENPARSTERIITMLETAGAVPKGYLKRSTVYDHFAREGLTRPASEKGTYRRFSAQKRNQRWLGDSSHLIRLPMPDGSSRMVFLVAWIDDYSRLITHGGIYKAEKLPVLEDCLKKAVIKFGVPEQIYVDNGAMYSALHFRTILGHLGIHLSHSRPYRAQGRGKIERFFALVKSGFVSEIRLMLDEGKALSLSEVNDYFQAWLKEYYHERVHSATKQKPILRFEKDPTPLRTINLEDLKEAFKLKDSRKVDKTGVFSLGGTDYQADLSLARKTVVVRYDPFEPGPVGVFFSGHRYPDASPLKIPLHSPNREIREVQNKEKPTGLNFVDLMAKQRDRQAERIRFALDRKDDGS